MDEYIVGNVRSIIYESNTNSYKVGIFKVREISCDIYEEYLNYTISFVGNFNNLSTELNYKFYGKLINHPKYGVQFNVTKYEMVNPTTNDEIVSYLGSGYFKGIGLKLAGRIVERFGNNSIDIIKNNPDLLIEIKGITIKTATYLSQRLNSLTEEETLVSDLAHLGFSINESIKIIKHYKLDLYNILKSNLYILSSIISFEKLDAIYVKYNDPNTDLRIENIIMHLIKKICYKSGDTLVSEEELYLEVLKYFNNNFKIANFKIYIENLIEECKVYNFNGYLMLGAFYDAEVSISEHIKALSNIKIDEDASKIDSHIRSFEKDNNIKLNPEQKNAIKESILNNLFIISGGPGTGKTTIIKAIVDYYKEKDSISLIAPTGRSAKRMGESVGLPASTIHKFLKWNKEDETFGLNAQNKDKSKIVIIDEFSMVDIFLFSSLLDALSSKAKLILLGDANQLPSINPGNILFDLLNSPNIKKQYLVNIYRTDENSYINILANKIKNVEVEEEFSLYDDFKFIELDDLSIINQLENTCRNIKQQSISLDEFQVLAPMYKGINGIDNLNIIMQNIFNPSNNNARQINYANIIFKNNDKVIQLVNDIDKNVYNGDIGYICNISAVPKKTIEVNFSGNRVKYEIEDFDKITLAYAISIHKSQGSEYDNVVMILASSHKRMFYNKLVYTGCTRAKKKLIIMGQKQNFNIAIKSNYSSKRNTYLNNLL